MSLHLLGWLCLITGLVLVRKELHGYAILAANGSAREQFMKLMHQTQLQWCQLPPVPSMNLPLARWTQVVSEVGEELVRMQNTVISSLPFPARAAHTKRAPAPAKEEEEVWDTDVPVSTPAPAAEDQLKRPDAPEVDTSHYLEIVVDINGKPTKFRYEEGSTSGTPLALAAGFCKDPSNGLGLISTEWEDCIATLSEELGKVMHPAAAPSSPNLTTANLGEQTDDQGEPLSAEGVRKLPLEVNGVTYVFEYHVDLDFTFTAGLLAKEFCSTKGAGIGLFTKDDAEAVVEEKCTRPLKKAIRVELVIAKNNLA